MKEKNNDVNISKTDSNAKNHITNRINLLSSSEINRFINSLYRPHFLGSIHLKKDTDLNRNYVSDYISRDLQMKLSKSIKNPLNNPITRYLLFVMILFNVLWILFLYIL